MTEKPRKTSKTKPPSFEQSLARLEEIVRSLEEGEVSLDEALAGYEEGVKLLRRAYGLLERAERRIELLAGVDADGKPITRPFADQATFDADRLPARGRPTLEDDL